MVKKIVALGVALVVVFVLSACIDPYRDETNELVYLDHFVVQLRADDGYAVIVDYTELGMEQEILVVPAYVDGLPVEQFGSQIGYYGYSKFKSENAKKIYFPYTLKFFYRACSRRNMPLLEESVFATGDAENFDRFSVKVSVAPSPFFELRNTESGVTYDGDHYYYEPNLIYNFNYANSPNGKYYWIDRIDAESVYALPQAPSRESFEFAGWYTDENCTAEWNGEIVRLPETLEIYAGWNEIA